MIGLYLIGAGGHCRSCIDVIESTGQFKILGLFDLPENVGKKTGPYEILGTDKDIGRFVKRDIQFLLTLGQIKTPDTRIKIVETLNQQHKINWAKIISPRAYVSKTAQIAAGTIVMHDALVNSYARIGQHVILNTKSLIEHDAVVEDFCHISTGAIVNGAAQVKSGSFVGSLSVLQESMIVPERSILSAGQFHKKNKGLK